MSPAGRIAGPTKRPTRRWPAFPKPSIAVITGACVGGGTEIAVACDLRLADTTSRFGITPARLGIVYPASATARVVRLIGPSATKHLLFSAELIDVDRALRIGLVDEVHDPAQLDDRRPPAHRADGRRTIAAHPDGEQGDRRCARRRRRSRPVGRAAVGPGSRRRAVTRLKASLRSSSAARRTSPGRRRRVNDDRNHDRPRRWCRSGVGAAGGRCSDPEGRTAPRSSARRRTQSRRPAHAPRHLQPRWETAADVHRRPRTRRGSRRRRRRGRRVRRGGSGDGDDARRLRARTRWSIIATSSRRPSRCRGPTPRHCPSD